MLVKLFERRTEGTTHSTHFIYSYMASDILYRLFERDRDRGNGRVVLAVIKPAKT